jgi:YggT family protein
MASDIGRYLVETIASLYLILVVLRGILQGSGADFYNPISQFIAGATNPALKVLRKLIPAGRRFDASVLVLALLVQALALSAVLILSGFMPPGIVTVGIWSLIGVAALLVNTYLVALIVMIVVSWVAPGSRHPAISLLYQITQPVMTPVRALLPNMGGLDFSPLLLFIVINVIQIALRHMAVASGLPPSLVMGL